MRRTRRTSVAMLKQIEEMSRQGQGLRAIAKCLGISRNTVRSILRSQSEGEVLQSEPEWRTRVDWEQVKLDWGKGVTLKVLHKEWVPEISYTQFRRYFRKIKPGDPKVTMRLEHKPGEKIHFDFADGINLINPKTGERTKTQLFLGTMPFSSKVWGEFVLNQKQTTMMGAVERVFHALGGVPMYAVFDNLKGAVTKAHIYDPDRNRGFCDFANYWGFAVLPARPKRPQDKGAVERSCGIAQQGFYNENRNRSFYTLRDLNEALWEYLKLLNESVMKDYGVSRNTRFEPEKAHLRPLARESFQISEWKSAKVHPDCHVQVDKRFYSVPFQWVGQIVQVRLTEKQVEIFSSESEPLAVHARLSGLNRCSTQDAHYPSEKLGVAQFAVKDAKSEANKVGPNTKALIDELLDTEYPLRHLRRAQGILRLVKSGSVTPAALEHAALQALSFKKTHLCYIKAVAHHFQVHGKKPTILTPIRDKEHIHLHNQQPKI